MQQLSEKGIPYNFIDSGQHADLTVELTKQFKLREPDIRMREERTNISTLSQAAIWIFRNLNQLAFS